MLRVVTCLSTALVAAALCLSPAAAATVTLKVGNGPGTVFDTAARLISRHIGQFLPGTPDVIVDNVTGGGGMLLVRQMTASEPNDGSVIGLINSGLVSSAVLTPDKAPFDPEQLAWIGSMGLLPSVCAVTLKSGINSIGDLAKADAKMGAGSSPKLGMLTRVISRLHNAKFQIVEGFDGMPEIKLAMERGEIDGVCGVTMTSYAGLGFDEIAKIIGTFDDGVDYNGTPVPLLWPEGVSDADRKAATMVFKDEQVFAPLMMPGTTDPKLVADYRQAFMQMIADPAFQEDAKQAFPNLKPTSGEVVDAAVKDLMSSDPATVARARELSQ